MEQRFLRNIPAITEEQQERLRTRRVFIAGCGGLGGYLSELMLRLGVGGLVAVDGDRFEESNRNRQLLATTGTMGRSKAAAAKQRAQRIAPTVPFTAIHALIDEKNADELIRGCDLALDALDNIRSRKLLENACGRAGIPLVHGAVRGWMAQACVCLPGERRLESIYPDEEAHPDKSVLPFAPALCASLQASLALKLLLDIPVPGDALYLFDLQTMQFADIRLLDREDPAPMDESGTDPFTSH